MNDALINVNGNILKEGDEFTIGFPADGIWEAYLGKTFRVTSITKHHYTLETVPEKEKDPDDDLFY